MNDEINETASSLEDVLTEETAKQDVTPTSDEPAPIPDEGEEVDYEQLAAADLAEIKRLDPDYAPATHLGELPFARRFAELRDLGLSVKEALAAAAPRFEKHNGLSHLRAIAPHGARRAEGVLDRDGMKEAKLLFGNLSEGEINALYRRVTNSHNN